MRNKKTLRITRISAVAAVYAVLTVAVAPLSYGDIQFRFAEMLMLLCFYKKDYCYSLILGCAIANLFSPMAPLDVPLGTLATALAALCMYKSKNIFISAVFPVIFNGIIVGAELTAVYKLPFLITVLGVAAGEAAVIAAGVIVFRFVLEKTPFFKKVFLPDKLC